MVKDPLPLWMNKASCPRHMDLPWTVDAMPDVNARRAMCVVCAECPVIIECSRYALSCGNGGFYAGVWIPWNDGESQRRMRSQARSKLKTRVKVH